MRGECGWMHDVIDAEESWHAVSGDEGSMYAVSGGGSMYTLSVERTL